ncbi:MAG: Cna B-type domain-containing protein [Eggerthellaceae bacterium]
MDLNPLVIPPPPNAINVTITNTGVNPITFTADTSSMSHFNVDGLGSGLRIESGQSATISVQPKTGLAKGEYNESFTLNAKNDSGNDVPFSTPLTVSASFSVVDPGSGSGEYYYKYMDTYPLKVYKTADNSIDTPAAYCINRSIAIANNATTSSGDYVYFDKISSANANDVYSYAGDGNSFYKLTDGSTTRVERTADDVYKHVEWVLLNGYNINGSSLQGSLSDYNFSLVTQAAIWHFTDPGYRASNGAYYNYTLAQHIDHMQYSGYWNRLRYYYPATANRMQEVYNKLIDEDGTDLVKPSATTTATVNLYHNNTSTTANHSRWQNLISATMQQTVPVNLMVKKSWQGDSGHVAGRPTTDQFKSWIHLFADGKDVTSQYTDNLEVTDNGDNTFTVSYTGLPSTINGKPTTYYVAEAIPDEYNYYNTTNPVASDQGTIFNTYFETHTSVSFAKVWNDDNNSAETRPSTDDFKSWITLQRSTDGTNYTDVDISTISGATLTVEDMGNNVFSVLYSGLPAVDESNNPYTYKVVENIPSNAGYEIQGSSEVTNGGALRNNLVKTVLTSTKAWNDNDNQWGNRPSADQFKTWVRLYANGNDVTDQYANNLTVTDNTSSGENTYTISYTDLQVKDASGNTITYTIGEEIPDEYKYAYTGGGSLGGRLVNTGHEITDVEMTKTWDDSNNAGNQRPTADQFKSWIHIYAGDTDVTSTYADRLTVTDNGDNTYSVKYSGLPAKDSSDNTITYTLKEVIPNGTNYVASESGAIANGGSLTNTSVTSVFITKKWDDSNNADGLRPTADQYKSWIKLTCDGNDVTSQFANNMTVTNNGNNTYTVRYNNLPRYNTSGTAAVYRIQEELPADSGYTASSTDALATGSTLVNSHTAQKTSLVVHKEWAKGAKGEKAVVELTANGEKTGKTLELVESENWTGTFTELEKYDSNGNEITYSVVENTSDWDYTVTKNADGSITITNYPKGEKQSSMPQTGDMTPLALLLGIGALAGLTGGSIALKRRRSNN